MLSIGHQRHYSMLYAHANEVVKSGVLGDVRHIRAQWHRNNRGTRLDANGHPHPTGSAAATPGRQRRAEGRRRPTSRTWSPASTATRAWKSWCRWRLYDRTGGGLMAELGSHQLDACSIFLGKKRAARRLRRRRQVLLQGRPRGRGPRLRHLRVPRRELPQGFRHRGGRRRLQAEGRHRRRSPIRRSARTRFEPYGECVMGSHGTMVVEQENKVMLFAEPDPNNKSGGDSRSTTVTVTSGSKGPVLEASSSSAPTDSAPTPGQVAGGGWCVGPRQPRLQGGDGRLRLLRPHVRAGRLGKGTAGVAD